MDYAIDMALLVEVTSHLHAIELTSIILGAATVR